MQQSQRAALQERGARAIRNLYHAATPATPRDFGPYADAFDSWVADAGGFEIEHMNDGGVYGGYAKAAREHAARTFKSEAAQRAYVRREVRRARLDLEKGAAADETRELFGKVYQWGRGGRTVAPEGLVRQRGGSSFSLDESALEGMNAADLTRAVRVVEAFGDVVESWNASVPEQWREYTAQRAADERAEARGILQTARAAVRAILADVRNVRAAGVQAPAICGTVRAKLESLREEMAEAFATLDKLASVQA